MYYYHWLYCTTTYSSVLVPDVIPRQQGQGFRVKPVVRNYAFEYEQGPRHKTEYLKITYSAKHGIPNTAVCHKGGKSFERIFGSTSSALELFLLKRKLMGPCWITIKHPKISAESVSWCKIEVSLESPKFVVKMPAAQCPPAPMLVMFFF
jgi:DNA polymerase alpha subunit A